MVSMTCLRFTVVALLAGEVAAFVTAPASLQPARRHGRPSCVSAPAPTMVYDDFDPVTGRRKFRWNLNVGRGPWGFAVNAEVWNGRVAMIAFVWITLQELIQGEGVVTKFLTAKSFSDVIVPSVIAGM
ncbi:hypothetical protein CTAYLR_005719 [Chrysophaeum taylorii]|uniref:Uncharacterized protein n=1 Tax=Chrysophaeum taylorii TaxID=2483200 RepID=A0AAD7UK70_9STRA|nr:hypothetical protein CTAYLR_005719 [Chrysophaeum taylorii]